LALLGIGAIDIFDRDIIEIHNLTRSVLFREGDVGQPKAAVAAARATELDPSVHVESRVGDFWATLSLRRVQQSSVVFCCVDNYEARIRLNRLCAIAGTPLINVGIDSRYAVVERFAFRTSSTMRETRDRPACYECALPAAAYADISTRYSCAGLRRIAVAEKRIPTTVLTSSAAATLAVSVHLRATRPDSPSRRLFQDTFTGSTTDTAIMPLDGCAGCGDVRGDRLVVSGSRRIASMLDGQMSMPANLTVTLSDQVVTRVSCPACGGDEPRERLFRTVDAFDERLATCPICGGLRQVGVRDRFTLDELMQEWRGYELPGKFLMADIANGPQVVIELEETNNGRSEGDPANRRSDAQGGSDDAQRTARGGSDTGRGDELVTAG
jgi:molybdopterin/thiamine biosynthesis adenylyltransferase